jgi:hypothetical protein
MGRLGRLLFVPSPYNSEQWDCLGQNVFRPDGSALIRWSLNREDKPLFVARKIMKRCSQIHTYVNSIC